MKKRALGNGGYTLLELIIVVAIIGIGIGVFISSISGIYSSDVKKCASELDSVLARCRISSMSRTGNVYLEICRTGDGVCVKYYEGDSAAPAQQDVIGKTRVDVTYTNGDDSSSIDSGSIFVKFDRSTGALRYIGSERPEADSFSVFANGAQVILNCSCNGSVRSVTVVASTGAHYLGLGGAA